MSSIDMGVVQELLDLCDDGDTSLVQELIGIFLDDGPTKIQAIQQGLRDDDLEAVERAAHSLKGSSGNLGANELMETAEALQNASRNGEVERSRELGVEIVARFDAANAELRRLLERYASCA
ncbi:MAG: Hpt domain-containing protein [Planctomycetes bacterium]|nr:Hpt domain-containing protein [Planctomycetota bacterium]